MRRSSVPDALPAVALHRTVPGLVWTKEQLTELGGIKPPRSCATTESGIVPENTPIELDDGVFVIVGEKIGEGRQGVVYSIATCADACVKLCRNEASAKQFRRELLGASQFDLLGVGYPAILGADSFGRWIVKDRWHSIDTGDVMLATTGRHLAPRAIEGLYEYAHKFERAGLCADWMPSNVVFGAKACETFETSVWAIESCGWTFMTCFLPVWLPHGISESDLAGFPPYTWREANVESARQAWRTDPAYEAWRDFFGDFPTLCSDWWVT